MALSMVIAAALGACAAAVCTGESSSTPTFLAQSPAPWVAANDGPSTTPAGDGAKSAVVVRRAEDGLFYVNLAVNGRSVRFVVDTGASVVVLSQSDAAFAGVAFDGAVVSVTTANGSSEMRWATVREVRVGDYVLNNVTATVANGAKTSLIGQNVLSKINRVEIVGDELRMI